MRRKLVTVSAESMPRRPLTDKEKATLERIAKQQAADDDSDIDYSDAPPLTDAQLATAVRGKFLTVTEVAKRLVTTGRNVRRMIKAGQLRATAVNPRMYLIQERDLRTVVSRPGPGRPVAKRVKVHA